LHEFIPTKYLVDLFGSNPDSRVSGIDGSRTEFGCGKGIEASFRPNRVGHDSGGGIGEIGR
jgi:hypothetical protein